MVAPVPTREAGETLRVLLKEVEGRETQALQLNFRITPIRLLIVLLLRVWECIWRVSTRPHTSYCIIHGKKKKSLPLAWKTGRRKTQFGLFTAWDYPKSLHSQSGCWASGEPVCCSQGMMHSCHMWNSHIGVSRVMLMSFICGKGEIKKTPKPLLHDIVQQSELRINHFSFWYLPC